MTSHQFNPVQDTQSGNSFDLFRLGKSKSIVDLCANTIRSYFEDGLPCYKRGKATFVSKAELAAFIRAGKVAKGGRA